MVNEVVICDLDHSNVDAENEVLKKENINFEWLHCKNQDEVIENCKGATVLLNQYVRMDEKIFSALPSVKCIVRYGVGYDNVNIEDATKYGVQVCNVPDYGTREVADQALALMMALTRKVVLTNSNIRKGVWDYTKNIPVYRNSAIVIGICGIGRIGTEFYKRAKALGAKIIAYDINYGNPDKVFPDDIEFVSFEEMVKRSDVISIHCVLDDTTYHMFGEKEFKMMKDSAYIVNVSRGGIIDEDALEKALSNKWIAGAGLDVVEKEPLMPDNKLLSYENFIISPHTAWYSEESSEELKRKAAEEAARFIKGEKVHYPINNLER